MRNASRLTSRIHTIRLQAWPLFRMHMPLVWLAAPTYSAIRIHTQHAMYNAAHLLETASALTVPCAGACRCDETAFQVQCDLCRRRTLQSHLDACAAAAEQPFTCSACSPPENGKLPAGLQACACCWSGSLLRCSPPQSLLPPCSLHCHCLQMPRQLWCFQLPLQKCCTGEGCSLDKVEAAVLPPGMQCLMCKCLCKQWTQRLCLETVVSFLA